MPTEIHQIFAPRLGTSLAYVGRASDAFEAFRHALHLHPGYIRARNNLGLTCVTLGDFETAAKQFIAALESQVGIIRACLAFANGLE